MLAIQFATFRSCVWGAVWIKDHGPSYRLTEGALADIVGLFECENGWERVIVLLDLLGRQVRVRVPAEVVAAAG